MSVRRIAAFALLPLVATAASAQTPPAAPVPPAARAAPSPAQQSMAVPGVSAAGNATLTRMFRAPDPGFKLILGQIKDVASQLQLETQRPVIDVEKVSTLVKRLESLQSQSRTRQNDRMLAALKALGPDDRGPFLRAISGQTQTAAVPH